MNELIKQVEQWSIDKDLHNGNSFTQYAKSSEEMGEVAAALCRDDIDELRDGIGGRYRHIGNISPTKWYDAV